MHLDFSLCSFVYTVSLLSSEKHLSPECQPVFGFVARHFPDDPVAFIYGLFG